jgi:hypothetical protein
MSHYKTILFQIFKYTIYSLLTYNIFLFFREDHIASTQVFRDGMSWFNIIEAYSASIDTSAWVILLLIFEVETYIVPEQWLKGRLEFTLNFMKTISYLFIVYSFYGYLMKYSLVHGSIVFNKDPCGLLDTVYTYIISLDEYQPITAEQCILLSSSPLYQLNGTQIIGTQPALMLIQRQAFVDVLNSADWLLIVLILEIDVYLQIRGKLTKRIIQISRVIKIILYSILFINAIYWGIEGTFLAFWDAFLWLIAFIFIEMNLLGLQAEDNKDDCHMNFKEVHT